MEELKLYDAVVYRTAGEAIRIDKTHGASQRCLNVDTEMLNSAAQKQLKYDVSYLRIAKLWSLNSHAERRKTGCIIVKDNVIISDGFNGMPVGYTNVCEDENGETKWEVLHAESNAIAKLAKSGQSSIGATIYVTFSPCKNCSKMILQSGIVRLVYLDEHSDVEGMIMLRKSGIEVTQYFLGGITI